MWGLHPARGPLQLRCGGSIDDAREANLRSHDNRPPTASIETKKAHQPRSRRRYSPNAPANPTPKAAPARPLPTHKARELRRRMRTPHDAQILPSTHCAVFGSSSFRPQRLHSPARLRRRARRCCWRPKAIATKTTQALTATKAKAAQDALSGISCPTTSAQPHSADCVQ
jgi:hypothetical protein